MLQFYTKLDLPVKFKPVFDAAHFADKKFAHEPIKINEIDPLFLKFLDRLGVTGVNSTLLVHIDGATESNDVKLNYIYGVGTSKMRWYKLKPNRSVKREYNVNNTAHISAASDDVDEVFSASVGEASLVNVGQLHGVTDISEPRICYCLCLYNKTTGERLQWDEAVIIFRKFIKPTA
jgi:hypothetical protein